MSDEPARRGREQAPETRKSGFRSGGLGRGLGALIPETAPAGAEPDSEAVSAQRGGPVSVDIDLIAPNPQQPRSRIDPELLAPLADSIRQHGLLQPLLVSRLQGERGNSYQLIAGERRLHAARAAGLQRVPVVVREASPLGQLELALVENIQRADLNPLEEALAFRRLAHEFGLTQEALAERVGRSRVAVANTLRLLGLPDEVKASLAAGEISEGHARALLGVADGGQQRQLWRQILERGLSVREVETLARRLRVAGPATEEQAAGRRQAARQDQEVAALAERLQRTLGTGVRIDRGRRGGRVVINFYSDEELDALIGRLLRDEATS